MSDELEIEDQQEVEASAESETAQEVEIEETEGQEVEAESEETSKPKPVEKRISTLVSKLHHKDQTEAQLRAELETLKALHKSNAAPEVVPTLPSDDLRYDDPEKYQKDLDTYYDYKAEQKFKSLQAQQNQTIEQAKVEEQKRVVQQRMQEIVSTYIDNGVKMGISEEKMSVNEQVLASAKLDRSLLEDIYSDEIGAKLVDLIVDEYIDELAGLSPTKAAVYVANVIKPKALSKKSKYTSAPDPIRPTRGAGAPPSNGLSPLIKGAIFE